jgi:hypothetical protein
MTVTGRLRHIARSTGLHVAFAFVAMGAWAAFVNHGHGTRAALLAFVVQGTLSGVLTLVLKKGLESGYQRLSGLSERIAPPLLSASLIAMVLGGVHAAAGTPEILKTVALPWTVSTLYAFVYTFTLPKKDLA